LEFLPQCVYPPFVPGVYYLSMTTVTFEENIKLPKRKFKNLSDFKMYLEKNSYIIKLKKLSKREASPATVKKMRKTRKMKPSDFVNI